MTRPQPIPSTVPPPLTPLAYQPVDAQAVRDAEHLRWLSVGHYVYGGLTMLCSSVFIVHIVIGIVSLRNPAMFSPPSVATRPAEPGAPVPPRAPPPPVPPRAFGWMFAGMGSAAVALGWTLGICNIVSGRCIRRRRAHLFSLIMAGVNCLNFPLGAAMGALTFIVLLRDSVRGLYAGRVPDPTAAVGR